VPTNAKASRPLKVGASRERIRIRDAQAARRARREQAQVKQKRLSTPERPGYTDAVFAIVITVTVLELHPPASAEIAALLSLWRTAVSYLVSYVFVAIVWMNHYFVMGYVKQTTLRVIWLNFTHLVFVSLLPFATAWMAATELARAPVVVYTGFFFVTDATRGSRRRPPAWRSAGRAAAGRGPAGRRRRRPATRAYKLFEREVLRNSSDVSAAELRVSRRRSLTAGAVRRCDPCGTYRAGGWNGIRLLGAPAPLAARRGP
jgi:hypothetical protein